jgi:hypothetical protein
MNKLKLNVEELSVDSFEVAPTEESRGTVLLGAEATDGCSDYCGATLLYIWNAPGRARAVLDWLGRM